MHTKVTYQLRASLFLHSSYTRYHTCTMYFPTAIVSTTQQYFDNPVRMHWVIYLTIYSNSGNIKSNSKNQTNSYNITKSYQSINHQSSSHPSSCFPPPPAAVDDDDAAPPPPVPAPAPAPADPVVPPVVGPGFIAAVPIALDRDPDLPCILALLPPCDANEEKSSQKSFRSGSMRRREAADSSEPSTKRLNESAAPRAPVWTFWPR